MKVGLAQCVNKGMQRDYSMDKSSQEFAYENKNIRITTTGNESFLSVTNERSTVKIPISLELPSDSVAIYDLTITRTGSDFDGVGKIKSAVVQFLKPLAMDATFTLQYKTSFVDSINTTISMPQGTESVDLMDYIETSNSILHVRMFEAIGSSVIPIWNQHENVPSSSDLGIILGATTIENKIVIFSKIDGLDYIIVGTFNNYSNEEELVCEYIYKGDLGFDTNHPIECITSYEADNLQKVYWVDGIHQPRVINVCEHYNSNHSFDFNPPIPEGIQVNIEKEYDGSGNFPSGIIQYFITFFNKFEAETGVAYESPLYYISSENRGGEVNEIHTCSFKIDIKVESNNFEYARVYSLIRTSLNSTPQVSIVEDVYLGDKESGKYAQIIDNNILNTPVASTDILFVGGNTIIANTIEQKDNTLFLGDIKELTTDVISRIKEIANKGTLVFGSKLVPSKKDISLYYPYSPNLDLSSRDIKTFKYLEWYKIGIQFQLNTGEWTSVVELGDIQNTVKPDTQSDIIANTSDVNDDSGIWLPALKFTPSDDLLSAIGNDPNIKNYRLVMAEHNPETRTVKAQGLVIPTTFNLKERAENTCYAAPIWTLNTALYAKHFDNVDAIHGSPAVTEVPINMYPFIHLPISAYHFKDIQHYQLCSVIGNSEKSEQSGGIYLTSIKPIVSVFRYFEYGEDFFGCDLELGLKVNDGETIYVRLDVYNDWSAYGQRRKRLKSLSSKVSTLIWSDVWDSSIGSYKISDIQNINQTDTILKEGELPSGDSLRDDYGVKAGNDVHITSIPSYVRDIVYNENTTILENHGNQYFLDANICNFISPDISNVNSGLKFRIVGYTDIVNSISDYTINVEDNVIGTTVYNYPVYNLNTFKMSKYMEGSYLAGIKTLPLWPSDNKMYYINYWSGDGNILNDKFNLKTKKFANMWVCGSTNYIDAIEYSNITNLNTVDNETVLLESSIYKSEYNNLIVPKSNRISYVGGNDINGSPSKRPINETAPLNTLSEAILDVAENRYKEDVTEKIDKAGAIRIKYKTSEHAVFQLPISEKGLMSILPNYTPKWSGDKLAYSTSTYPVGIKMVDYCLSAYTPEQYIVPDIEFESTVSISIDYSGSLSIGSRLDTGDQEISVVIPSGNMRYYSVLVDLSFIEQPSPTVLFEDFFQQKENSTYNNTNILFNVIGKDEFLYLKSVKYEVATKSSVTLSANMYVSRKEYPYAKIRNPKIVCLLDTYRSGQYSFTSGKSFITPSYSEDLKEINSKIFIGEFYNDYDENTFFGGKENNNYTFVPISESCSKTAKEIWGLEGDTYYQRYDNVRLYEYGSEDTNQNIDAVSFMLETYKNLDGDYRKLRGRLDTINLTEANTNNTLNDVYSQVNNYITSYIMDDKFDDSTHPTLYAWSLTKQNLADIDVWTSINLANSAKLDGDKGALTKIKRWNNQLIAFQEKSTAIINFNQQTTISTSEGIPIEIANSGKVTGHYYLSSTQGCVNKWSIIDSPYGIYFIDSYNKSINIFNSEGIRSLSTIHLFQDWTIENEKGIIWNPSNNGGFKSFYDPIHKEVYFVNNKTALCYNELLGQFTSFYDYDKLNSMISLNGSIYGIRENEVHKMFANDAGYCNLFGRSVGYSMTYKVNKDPYLDKVWTNLEYRADVFNDGSITDSPSIINDTFNTLEVWNEYQKGQANLKGDKYPNAKCKFRIWRADIPRDFKFKRDRIRNPWIMLKLEKTSNTNKRMEFHDLIVKYLQ